MSNKVDPLKLFLNNKSFPKPKRLLTLENVQQVKEEAVKGTVKEKVYARTEQKAYFMRFEEKGLAQINCFIKHEQRDSIGNAVDTIRKRLDDSGQKSTKINRHLIFSIIVDYYFENNPEFIKSIEDAIFTVEEKD